MENKWSTQEDIKNLFMRRRECGLGSILAQCHMRVEFVHCSRLGLRLRFFSGFSGFPPCTNSTSPNSNSTSLENAHENQVRLMWPPVYIQSRSQSFVPHDQRSEIESSGSNHFEITKEITEFQSRSQSPRVFWSAPRHGALE